jgi:hypothetical protein
VLVLDIVLWERYGSPSTEYSNSQYYEKHYTYSQSGNPEEQRRREKGADQQADQAT